jgi:hypothetical protein
MKCGFLEVPYRDAASGITRHVNVTEDYARNQRLLIKSAPPLGTTFGIGVKPIGNVPTWRNVSPCTRIPSRQMFVADVPEIVLKAGHRDRQKYANHIQRISPLCTLF